MGMKQNSPSFFFKSTQLPGKDSFVYFQSSWYCGYTLYQYIFSILFVVLLAVCFYTLTKTQRSP